MKPMVTVVVVCLVALVGCDRGGATPAPPSPSPSPSAVTETPSPTPSGLATPTFSPDPSPSPTRSADNAACANEAAILRSSRLLKPGSLQGDVDGDGTKDIVRIAVDPGGPEGCRAFVRAQLANGTVAAPIPQWEPTLVLPAPHLNSIAQIDRVAGGEIVVDVAAGASTQFEGVYTLSGGKLISLTLKGGGVPFEGLFAYGGSVGHLDGEACTRRGLVVVSGAVERGTVRYKVVRQFFRPGVSVLKFRRTTRDVIRRRKLRRLPEFSGPPFAGCARA